MPSSRIRCWLIGADSLLAECGDILLRGGHELHGVVTSSDRIGEWARARRLPVLASPEELLAAPRAPFDYLFAITHLAVLSDAVLALPERGAINFHDGPLPDYAGLNAPAWALMNGEPRYGVTWHCAHARVDAGDVLKQRTFDVAPDETAFSLNAKCFGAAIDSFAELVGELATDSARPRPQDLARRRYFARHRRPSAAAAIDWTRPAAELAALVRALDFGRYPNDLGVAKIARGGEVVLVTRASAIDAAAEAPAGTPEAPAGTVVAIDGDAVHVATGRGLLALTALAETSGRSLPLSDACRRWKLAPGVALDRLTPECAQRLDELDRRMSRDERFWIDRLARLDPITLPFAVRATPSTRSAPAAIPIAVPTNVRDDVRATAAPARSSSALFSAWCGYLARLARRDAFDIGFCDDALRTAAAGLEGWVGAHVAVRVEVDRSATFGALASRCADALADIDGRAPWSCDVAARQARLAHLREVPAGELFPVVFERVARFGSARLPRGTQCSLEVQSADGACRLVYDTERVAPEIARSIASGFEALLASIAAAPELAVAEHAIVRDEERARQLVEWNRTARPYDATIDVYTAFEAQASRSPRAVALVCEGRTVDYRTLRERAERFAAELERRGVREGDLVGVSLERSIDMVVAVLAILQVGAAYVPLDPSFPAERIAFMVEDARLRLVVTQSHLESALPVAASHALLIDALPPSAAAIERRGERASRARPDGIAYVIYTSGSTGRPKGVQVEHRNVASFFAAMDEHVPHDEPGTWLAVTSLSFDISVLEILWTLARGFRVVIHTGVRSSAPVSTLAPASTRAIDFSLFYFASDEGAGDGYRLLLEGARFADTHDFRAVWTPERHFHAFGGLFPNPAVTSAAIAAITQRVAIRAGSVVLPLHHPVRVAEEWALVDNLSNGRAAISFASGWQPDDFVLAPHRGDERADAKSAMLRDIEVVRRLWRGETVSFPGPEGDVAVRTMPRPVQPELVYWITAAGNVDTFVAAGGAGANVLTHLLGQSVDELAAKVALYRAARAEAGHDPATGVVTLMLHTFVGEDEAQVAQRARAPLERYLESSLSLLGRHAASFPAFRRASSPSSDGGAFADLDADERAALLAHVSERYMESDGLFGTPERCLAMVERVRAAGVDEIACLVDFGVPADDVLASLPLLDRVRRSASERARARDAAPTRDDESIAALVQRERVTHLQCTPSLARLLCDDPETRAALRGIRHVFVGGEALPVELARELQEATGARLTNMYGPTETTVWSTTHVFQAHERAPTVPIGRPIANTRAYVLDAGGHPLPIGACGELFLGGDGVTRGYLRRPELDAQRFLADPFADAPGARMYRTGDLARHRHDGVLEFLGRDDQQIKVRGHRIEPGEIESVLLRESSIAECVVIAREDVPGDQRLVAYCVPRGPAPDAAFLRQRLKAALPDYMVPSHVVFLDALPRTPNMKVDRRALRAPDMRTVTGSSSAARPANELESRLAALWQEILGVEHVGVDDNFFDLGGQSLLVVRIHRRMSELAPRPVSLTDLFRFPTIRALARFLASDAPSDAVDGAVQRGEQRRLLRRRRQRVEEA